MDLSERIARLSPEKLAVLERRLRRSHRPAAAIVPRGGGRRQLPLSFAQQRLWFLDRLQPGSASYNVAADVRLGGSIDLAALRRTLGEIVRRHEALRTTFRAIDGQPQQVIEPRAEVDLPLIDLRSLPPHTREAEAHRLSVVEAERSFDLERGPLFRACLMRTGPEEQVLLLTMHHIVSDAWSVRILLREIATLYDAFRSGRPSPLPELPIQYADFALWQQSELQGGRLATLLDYWRGALAGAPAVLELPFDRPRPAVQTFRGAAFNFMIPPHVAAALRAAGQREGATLFMTLLAAFALLLHRICGQNDLIVGTPVANRNRADLEGLIGFFTNTLVIRSRLGHESFRELLAHVRQTTLDAFAHQDLPFEKLVEELQPERSLSHNPLFQVLFTLQSAHDLPVDGGELDSPDAVRTAKFDLSFFVIDSDRGLHGSFEYNTDLWDAATIERLSGNLLTLLEGIAHDPDEPARTLPLLTEAEQRRVEVMNATEAPVPEHLVHERFTMQALATPNAEAVVRGQERWSFAQLESRANRMAHFLRASGAGPESIVGIALPRSLDLCAAVLGTIKAGAAYLPLDPTLPASRIDWILADANPLHVIDEAFLSTHAEAIETQPDSASPSHATPDTPVYLLYTSGSTGRPKGVVMTHRAAANLIEWQIATAAPAQTTLQFASLAFDVAFQELFATWCSGGTLVLVDEETRRDPDLLLDHIAAHRIERIFLPYVALRQLALARPRPLPLRTVITAGEALRIDDRIAQFFAALPDCALHNQYGPTESHVVTEAVLRGDPKSWPEQPPIGRPIANVEVHVLDEALQPVPEGVRGELYLGGAALARGYHARPDLTAERFVPHPFDPERRLYRTGDVVCRRAGDLEFLGRRDHQVKIRGYRVELGEIESVLREHPDVREAAVVVQQSGGEKRLAAFVVASASADVASFLRQRLPEYMVPALIEISDALPLTATGKIDRLALERRVIDAIPVERFIAPRTPLEEKLASIWREILGVERIGVEDNFFSLGGHSLTATQVVSRIRDVYRTDVPLRLLFESPTIAALAAAVEASVPALAEPAWSRSAVDVEELPDAEVDRLLLTMLGAVETPAEPDTPPNVGALSDDEVDRLLQQMLAAEAAAGGAE